MWRAESENGVCERVGQRVDLHFGQSYSYLRENLGALSPVLRVSVFL